jgi:hypothetical protein
VSCKATTGLPRDQLRTMTGAGRATEIAGADEATRSVRRDGFTP